MLTGEFGAADSNTVNNGTKKQFINESINLPEIRVILFFWINILPELQFDSNYKKARNLGSSFKWDTRALCGQMSV